MIQDELEHLIKPLVNDLGYELWGCEYLAQGKHSLLRIYIDKEGGIGISDCEQVSRQVSALLDVEDPISGLYSLEVSSPGIPRPLFNASQYKRYIGSDVQLKLYKSLNGTKKINGTISDVNDEKLLLKVGEDEVQLELSQIVKANLIGE